MRPTVRQYTASIPIAACFTAAVAHMKARHGETPVAARVHSILGEAVKACAGALPVVVDDYYSSASLYFDMEREAARVAQPSLF